MARYRGRHIAPRGGYQPQHAARRTMDDQPSTGALIVAVGLTITGIIVIGSGLAIRNHPVEPVPVAGPDYVAPDVEAAVPPPADAILAVAPAAPPPGLGASTGTCVASWYPGSGTTGPKVATAAQRGLPLGSTVRITNLANGLSTVVKVSGRAATVAGRCLNLSRSAFTAIADLGAGLINVRYEPLT